jgi:hypothetical protein
MFFWYNYNGDTVINLILAGAAIYLLISGLLFLDPERKDTTWHYCHVFFIGSLPWALITFIYYAVFCLGNDNMREH